MSKTESRSVQEIAIQRTKLLSEFFIAAFAVDIVSYDRVADCSKMHPYLMRAAGPDPDFEKRTTTEFCKPFVLRVCGPTPRFPGSHFRADGRMSSYRQFDSSSIANEPAMDERGISFLNLSILKCFTQLSMSKVVLCDNQ